MTRIEEIKARLEAATPGPWEFSDSSDIRGSKGEFRAPNPHNGFMLVGPWTNDADAAFIAHAREDVPYLLDQLSALQGRVDAEKPRKVSYLSTAEFARLNHACLPVTEAFGFASTYLVGSATQKDTYRDVDIRTILDDDEFDALFKGRPFFWSLTCLGIATYLREVSGLPIDYQIQRRTEANEKHIAGSRNPIGTRGRLFAGGGDATPINVSPEQGEKEQ